MKIHEIRVYQFHKVIVSRILIILNAQSVHRKPIQQKKRWDVKKMEMMEATL